MVEARAPPRPRNARAPLPARTLGRTEATRDDRAGAVRPTRHAPCRRTDDGSGRDASGRDSGATAYAATGRKPHASSHHARPRARRSLRRPSRPHVRGRDGGVCRGAGFFCFAPTPLCDRASRRAPRSRSHATARGDSGHGARAVGASPGVPLRAPLPESTRDLPHDAARSAYGGYAATFRRAFRKRTPAGRT